MLAKGRENLSDEEKDKLDSISIICDDDIYFPGEEYPYFLNESAISYIKQSAPSLADSVGCSYSYYLSGEVDCGEYMDTVVTDEGTCFAFNALPNNAVYTPVTVQYYENMSPMYEQIWTPEQGFLTRNTSLKKKPYRAFNIGLWNGLSLSLQLNASEQDFNCTFIQGYKVILTNPAESLALIDFGYYLPSSGFTQIAISPNVMDTSEDLRHYSSNERHCLYPHERQLEFFQTYTQDNCRLECLSKFTLNKCACVAFYMPRTNSTLVCGPRSKECVGTAFVELNKLSVESALFEDGFDACSCLPACKTIKYTADISQSNLDLGNVLKNSSSASEDKNIFTNLVMIYFKETEFLASRRGELYGFGGFVAQCGGLLGLCCGLSILSILELIYYFIIRVWSKGGTNRLQPEK